MAYLEFSTKEFERVAQLCLENKTVYAMLCNNTSSLTKESSVASWQSVELSGNGYTRASEITSVGSYNAILNNYSLPEIYFQFNATGAGLVYTHVVFYISGATYPYGIMDEVTKTISPGQVQTYSLRLNVTG